MQNQIHLLNGSECTAHCQQLLSLKRGHKPRAADHMTNISPSTLKEAFVTYLFHKIAESLQYVAQVMMEDMSQSVLSHHTHRYMISM